MENINKKLLFDKLKICYKAFETAIKDIDNNDKQNILFNKLIAKMLPIFTSFKSNSYVGGYYNCTKKIDEINKRKIKGGEIIDLSYDISKILQDSDVFEPSIKTNIVIAGAGPNGLYLAILLKTALPNIDIIIVENRINENGQRILERVRPININGSTVINNNTIILQLIEIIKLYSPELLQFFITKPY